MPVKGEIEFFPIPEMQNFGKFVTRCGLCGALVVDEVLHVEYHSSLLYSKAGRDFIIRHTHRGD